MNTACRNVWRNGFVPVLSDVELLALAEGLQANDPRIIQSATTEPSPLFALLDWPCEGACALGYAGWRGNGLALVDEVNQFFSAKCFEADRKLGEPAACRYFLDWYDSATRDVMRSELLQEINIAIDSRRAQLENAL